MQISTSVGVVQDILISLSFQKNAKLIYIGPFQVARSAGRDMRQLPCGGIGVSPSLRSSRASEANVPERAIAHRQKRADCRLLDAPSEGGHQPAFQGSHQATRPCLPGYSARLRGHAGNRTHTRPQSATCAERAIRLLSPRLLVVPRSASRCQFIRLRRVVSRLAPFAPPSARCRTWQS